MVSTIWLRTWRANKNFTPGEYLQPRQINFRMIRDAWSPVFTNEYTCRGYVRAGVTKIFYARYFHKNKLCRSSMFHEYFRAPEIQRSPAIKKSPASKTLQMRNTFSPSAALASILSCRRVISREYANFIKSQTGPPDLCTRRTFAHGAANARRRRGEWEGMYRKRQPWINPY